MVGKMDDRRQPRVEARVYLNILAASQLCGTAGTAVYHGFRVEEALDLRGGGTGTGPCADEVSMQPCRRTNKHLPDLLEEPMHEVVINARLVVLVVR